MLPRLVFKSITVRRKRSALIFICAALGATLISAILTIAFGVEEKVARELREYGANIMVVPRGEALNVEIAGIVYPVATMKASLPESKLIELKKIFWRNNIVGFAPFLYGIATVKGTKVPLVGTWYQRAVQLPEGKSLVTGVKSLNPGWRLQGWGPSGEGPWLIAGARVAARLGLKYGDVAEIEGDGNRLSLPVSGILFTGGFEEDQLLTDLTTAQGIYGLPGEVDRVQVSALVKPDDKLAIRARADPKRLPKEEFERWYCSPYISAVLYQIEEAIPGSRAKAIRQVAEAEGSILGKVKLIFFMAAIMGVAGAAVSISSAAGSAALERYREVALMKALGASRGQVFLPLILEAATIGFVGGLTGFLGGTVAAGYLGSALFSSPISPTPVVLPVTLAISVAVALLGHLGPLRELATVRPAAFLKEG